MTEFSWSAVLGELTAGHDLDREAASWAIEQVMSGQATPSQVGALLMGLRAKGPTADEVAAAADTMLAHARPVRLPGPEGPGSEGAGRSASSVLLDVVGTGGDGAGSVNFSTMAAVVAVAAGARVAKHGNRAASSQTGTADVLEELGIAIDLEPPAIASCIEATGIGFCFAPVLHPAMRHAGPVRKEMGIPTVFNILGPLTNPARPRAGLIGCADAAMAPIMAEVFQQRGDRVILVRGDDGLDEITPYTTTSVWDVTTGSIETTTLAPEDLGLAGIAPGALAGGNAVANAEVARAVFGMPRHDVQLVLPSDVEAVTRVVIANAAAALVSWDAAVAQSTGAPVTGSLLDRISAHLPTASAAITSGAAATVFLHWIDTSQHLRGGF